MLSDPSVVQVRFSEGKDLCDAMNRWRSWLDGQKIQPTVFMATTSEGYAFKIGFRTAAEAELFRKQFATSAQ